MNMIFTNCDKVLVNLFRSLKNENYKYNFTCYITYNWIY